MKQSININCDMGEGMGNDAAIMPLISSCNIACGGHAGDEASMKRTVELAVQYQVKIGAHPSYPDKQNFGRKVMDISNAKLIKSLTHQIQLLVSVVKQYNTTVDHLKLHGALYNQTYEDLDLAKMICRTICDIDPGLTVYAPAESAMAKQVKEHGLSVIFEAFADRAYKQNGSLVSRELEGALLTDPDKVVAQVKEIVSKKTVTSQNGVPIDLRADTFCVHSDTPSAVEILERLNKEFHVE